MTSSRNKHWHQSDVVYKADQHGIVYLTRYIAEMSDRYASYGEMLDAGLFSTEANCLQYLLDIGILPNQRRCPTCVQWMMILPCSPTYSATGACWQCCGRRICLRSESILSRRRLTCRKFIDVLYEFSRGSSVREAAEAVGLSQPTTRSIYKEIRERMAEDISTQPKIGVEVMSKKFFTHHFYNISLLSLTHK